MGAVFTCSIDDGHPSDMRVAELMHKHGIHGTFYIPVKNSEGDEVLSDANIRELGTWFEIGSHTRDHCYLKHVDIWHAYHQINDGKKYLEDVLGSPVNGFCYPGGRYRRRDVELVQACGFTYARTTMNLCFDPGTRPYELPTTMQFFPHDRWVYIRNFIASGKWVQRADGLLLALQHEHWLARLYAMFGHVCERGGIFHLWWHSRQIDELDAWDDIDAFFGHVASQISLDDRLRNRQVAALIPEPGVPRVVGSV